MCLFLRFVITFDKKERKIHLIDYIYYNVNETKVSCLHQNEVVAHSSYVQIFLRSQQLTSGFWNLFLAEGQAFLIMSASIDESRDGRQVCRKSYLTEDWGGVAAQQSWQQPSRLLLLGVRHAACVSHLAFNYWWVERNCWRFYFIYWCWHDQKSLCFSKKEIPDVSCWERRKIWT